MNATLPTPITDALDRIEHPKADYPLKGDEWVPIDDCRELELRLAKVRAALMDAIDGGDECRASDQWISGLIRLCDGEAA